MTRALVALALLAACDQAKDAPAPASTGSAKPPTPASIDAAPAPLPPKTVDVEVSTSSKTGTLKVTIPGEWQRLSGAFYGMRNESSGEAIIGIGFNATCDGLCDPPAKLVAQMNALVDGAPERAKAPNYNTGKPELDAVRLDVATVDQGDLPGGGRFVVYTVAKPAGLEGPYRQTVEALCARPGPKRDVFYTAHAVGPLARAKELTPLLAAACKSLEVR